MIELKVEPYCHDCPDFEADVSKRHERVEGAFDQRIMDYPVKEIYCTIVRCAHANRCRAIKRYLEKPKGE